MTRPLASNRRLVRLLRNQVIWTRLTKFMRRPIAWVTSGAPVELLLAYGITPFYPENHAAICAARGLSLELASKTEELGWSQDLCSYFRVDIGTQVTGRSPLGSLVLPDLVLVCNNICGTVQNWFKITAQRLGIPFLFLDTPFSDLDGPPRDFHIMYVRDQLVTIARDLARITRRPYNEKRVLGVAMRSLEALALWAEILQSAKHVPAPFTSFDAFVHMAPIVSLRGTRRAVWYYRALLKEVRGRAKAGIAAIEPEIARVVWDNIAVWPLHRALKRLFSEYGVALVADSYTSAWQASELVDKTDVLAGLARAYTGILLNRGVRYRANLLEKMITDFGAAGFILHSNRSCKRFSIGQYALKRYLTEKTGAIGLVVEADMADPRLASFDHIRQRLVPFFETLRSR